jgi:CBS domain-containing protein
MRAHQIMTRPVITISPDASIIEAASIMLQRHISGLPVVDAAGQLVGIVTERDFLQRSKDDTARWLDVILGEASGQVTADQLHDRRVEDVMSKNAISVGVEAPVSEVTELMERHGVRRLPVVADGKVVGIVSVTDLLLALMRKTNRIPDPRA